MMKVCFAPMEGIAHHLYRAAHAACFTPADEYFIPFINPRNRTFSHRERQDVLPENNAGMHAVPQILTHDAQCFLWAAGELHAMGYDEVNLNLGCPSATVVGKRNGAGLLKYPEQLNAMLTEIFLHSPVKVSVKTRLGMEDLGELEPLMEIYNRYPLARLIVHPRLREDYYQGEVHMAAFYQAVNLSRAPVWYNGDLFTAHKVAQFCEQHPGTAGVMCGRGFLLHPGLMGALGGSGGETAEQLEAFHDRLYADYRRILHNVTFTLCKMKEVWTWLGAGQKLSPKAMKRIRKAGGYESYDAAVRLAFQELAMLQ